MTKIAKKIRDLEDKFKIFSIKQGVSEKEKIAEGKNIETISVKCSGCERHEFPY